MSTQFQIEEATASKTVPFSFYEIVANIFSRYPSPFSQHVQCIDYLQPLTIDAEGCVSTKMLNLKLNKLPSFMSSHKNEIGMERYCPEKNKKVRLMQIIEEYKINLATHTMQQLSYNYNARNFLKTHEFVTYVGLFDVKDNKSLDSSSSSQPVGIQGHKFPEINDFDHINSKSNHLDQVLPAIHQCYINKSMYCSSPMSNSIVNYLSRKYAKSYWQKSEIKSTHGLCYTIANNFYNKNLANEFLSYGLNDTAINRMKDKLINYRTILWNNRHYYINDLGSKTLSQLKEHKDEVKRRKEEIKAYIKNPRFQLMCLEKLKKFKH